MILTVNNASTVTADLSNGNTVCFLWGKKWKFVYDTE